MGEFQGVEVGAADVTYLISVKPPHLGNFAGAGESFGPVLNPKPSALAANSFEAPSYRVLAL